MLERKIPQNRTLRQKEPELIDSLRQCCYQHGKVILRKDARNIEYNIKRILKQLRLGGYDELIAELRKTSPAYEEHHFVSHFE